MNWSYLAGFFDGEGHTRSDFHRNGTSLQVVWSVTQKNQEVLDEIALFLLEHGYTPRFQANREKHCAVISIYSIHEVERLLEELRPLVIVKRAQIDAVLLAIRSRPIKKQEYRTKKHTEMLARTREEIASRRRPRKKHKTGATVPAPRTSPRQAGQSG